MITMRAGRAEVGTLAYRYGKPASALHFIDLDRGDAHHNVKPTSGRKQLANGPSPNLSQRPKPVPLDQRLVDGFVSKDVDHAVKQADKILDLIPPFALSRVQFVARALVDGTRAPYEDDGEIVAYAHAQRLSKARIFLAKLADRLRLCSLTSLAHPFRKTSATGRTKRISGRCQILLLQQHLLNAAVLGIDLYQRQSRMLFYTLNTVFPHAPRFSPDVHTG